MIEQLDYKTLQHLWWLLCSVVGALFLFLTFVQGGQSLLWQVAKTQTEKDLVINSLGRKWEMTFTTLVLFGGALFASFPKFYSTSFGGAYWVWILILFTFIVQAVSYEYRKKPWNIFGSLVYEGFLFINGVVGILLIGAAVGTFYTGANFQLSANNFVTWTHPLRGLEAALSPSISSIFNIAMGLFLVFNARTLGAMYLINNVELGEAPEMETRLRRACWLNFLIALPLCLLIVVSLLFMRGYGIVDDRGTIAIVSFKFLLNLLANPWMLVLLVGGLALLIFGVWKTAKTSATGGIWYGGLGTVLIGLTVLMLPAYNNTAFYPSKVDLQASLTIYNASSSPYTLKVMTYVALGIPFVLAYIAYVWWAMNRSKIKIEDTGDRAAY
ncbi:cytochrome bd quinol oxidase subunit 2 apoprotein [Desulfobulbus propionicus DSM 2032]|jgi:cytochrome d ubiquinol oxidase subunit II|uniref:Cytochrome bd quinol oxidase subunit 2 apoprotein n=1 Tax=Desulfobulbus propionicus (strain ATCC 33891 / DSM 2032 / VKM B-1956 / 1pr3) TaxID=577650 RepID=A0A7U3YJV8_DESPD|nr:cytochrome d ubiquinol oxidase subunit II [Desulfobulbus propionicus]ADW16742.1 cytochrome bd quinol oxidase subunit 2 apoprotein [Desulfobulbus propionicus DSM 2032]